MLDNFVLEDIEEETILDKLQEESEDEQIEILLDDEDNDEDGIIGDVVAGDIEPSKVGIVPFEVEDLEDDEDIDEEDEEAIDAEDDDDDDEIDIDSVEESYGYDYSKLY